MEAADNHLVAGSWPLFHQSNHFDLGHVLNSVVVEAIVPAQIGAVGSLHSGIWECDLSSGTLIWSGGIYDMFGLERGVPISRELALSHYSEDSRAKLERLRAHAIRNKLGFTIDIEIRPAAAGTSRRLRVIGAPVYEGEVAVRLHGLKLIL